MDDLETIKKILAFKTIAVVGLSPKPDRPSHGVAAYLQSQGYHIIPINPGYDEILGERSYPSLKDIPQQVEVVDIFRRAEALPGIVADAIAIGAQALWMQDGIIHEVAAKQARQAGILVVMNDCMLRRHQQLYG